MNNSHKIKGFTVADLLVATITIVIVATIAFPSYRHTVNHWRTRLVADELVASLMDARISNITHHGNEVVGLCGLERGQKPTECSDIWDGGFAIYRAETPDTSKVTLSSVTQLSRHVQVCSNTWNRVYFDKLGRTHSVDGAYGNTAPKSSHSFTVSLTDCKASDQNTISVQISPTGAVYKRAIPYCPSTCESIL